MTDSGGHMVHEALAWGCVPICPDDHGVGGGVEAPFRGKDFRKYGHRWVEHGVSIWCVTRVLPEDFESEEEG